MKDKIVQGELFVNWNGHEVTESQLASCEAATEWLHDWDLPVPEGIEDRYERDMGKSCVYWGGGDDPGEPYRDDLPRDEGYSTNGYTPEFVSWVGDRTWAAVCVKGLAGTSEIWDFVRKEA